MWRSIALAGGTADYVVVKDSPSLGDMEQLTLAAWVNLDAINGHADVIVGKDFEFLLAKDGYGRLYFNYSKTGAAWNGAVFCNASFNAGQWYHVAATYNSSTGAVKMYVDGKLVGNSTVSSPGVINASSSVLTIGKL